MELKLIKDEVESATTPEKNQFAFFKNAIQKDLEITGWCNNAVRVFGDFQIYTDHKSELNSFDQLISFLTGKRISTSGETLEEYISSQCSEYFMDLLILKEKKLTSVDYDQLAERFTNYILEACEVLKSNTLVGQEQLKLLDRKYFGVSNLGTYNHNRLYSH